MSRAEQNREDTRTTIHFVRARDVAWLMHHFAVPQVIGGELVWVIPDWLELMQRTVRVSD